VAQLKALRGDLRLEPLRGNVDTRVRKAQEGQYDAVCIAAAGLQRLELADVVSEYLSLDQFLPAPGQGALAIQCRADDENVRHVVSLIDDPAVRAAVEAERGFLAGLGGGCAAPVGAIGEIAADGSTLHLRGVAAAIDGSRAVRVEGSGTTREADALGRELADDALAQGAADFIT
jgi:hydroxymethylbilane synthase